MNKKMPDDVLKDKLSKYDRPKNIPELIVTKVNQPVWDNLYAHTRTVDVKLQKTQNSLVRGMCTLISFMQKLKKGTEDRDTIYKGMLHAVSLFANADRELLCTERSTPT